ncbi:DMT family transporter [Oricola sp.]|uniref:DMT family transporter n=1 Tax=Oricola sp. TaxID=1979950 RepID=UPI0025F9EA11|nr:DMT family transporter [Oricola sp.]MCI5077303.1 DMT family transporter [Oricola sp.]
MRSQKTVSGTEPDARPLEDFAALNGDNLKAIALLAAAMALFALDDMFIKLASSDVGVGQIVAIQNGFGIAYFAWLAKAHGKRVTRDALFSGPILLRHIGETTGVICFVSALALMPISDASAILQASPLVVVFGAALFLRETVGWRRWAALLVGFAGVLLVLRPGMSGFDAKTLLPVGAAIGFAMRDLGTRAAPRTVSTEAIALVASVLVFLAAILLQTLSSPWSWMSPRTTGYVLAASAVGIIAFHLMMIALRMGQLSVVAPFRYVRIVCAMAIGVVVFAERPDVATIGGSILIVASGLYTLYREQVIRNRRIRGS